MLRPRACGLFLACLSSPAHLGDLGGLQISDAAKALLACAAGDVAWKAVADDDPKLPFYYVGGNSWERDQDVPWHPILQRPLTLAEGIAQLAAALKKARRIRARSPAAAQGGDRGGDRRAAAASIPTVRVVVGLQGSESTNVSRAGRRSRPPRDAPRGSVHVGGACAIGVASS